MVDGRSARGRAGEAHSRTGTAATSRPSLELLPDAVAVTDRSRRIVSSNQRFDAELRRAADDTCCDVLGCRAIGACVTETVLAQGQPWRGVVTPPGSDAARELAATPLMPAANFVVLRFGEASPAPGPSREGAQILRVFCLGSLRIGEGAADGADAWLQQRPGMLLKYLLAMRHRHVRPEEIAEALWESTEQAGPGNVRYLVHQLRKRLEPGGASGTRSHYLRKDPAGYQLDPANVWVDADAFEAAARAAVAAAVDGEPEASEQALLRAVALYRGDFLCDDPYEEWALPERDRLHAMLDPPLRMLIEARLAAGDVEGAAAHAERLAAHEPLDADVQRLWIELLFRLGRRSRAVRQYEMFRKRLWRVLGVGPPFELAELFAGDP